MTTGGSSDSVSRIREVFLRARELPFGPDRDSYLDQACSSAPEMRTKIERMLVKESASDAFLEGSTA